MHVSWCESLWYTIHFSFGSWKKDFYFLQQERPFSLWQKRQGGWVWQWWLCQAEMLLASVYHLYVKLFITFTHPHPAHIISTISCGRSVLNCYLMESAPENHQSRTFKAAARPRVTNALRLIVAFMVKKVHCGFSYLLLFELSDCPESFFSTFLWNYLRWTLLIRCCAQQQGLWERPQGATCCLDGASVQAAQEDLHTREGGDKAKHKLWHE